MYECVCEWVNPTRVVKHFDRSVDCKHTVEMKVHLPLLKPQYSQVQYPKHEKIKVSPKNHSSLLYLQFAGSWCVYFAFVSIEWQIASKQHKSICQAVYTSICYKVPEAKRWRGAKGLWYVRMPLLLFWFQVKPFFPSRRNKIARLGSFHLHLTAPIFFFLTSASHIPNRVIPGWKVYSWQRK